MQAASRGERALIPAMHAASHIRLLQAAVLPVKPFLFGAGRHPMSSSSTVCRASNLVEWVHKSGGKADGVDVVDLAGKDGGSGFGLVARAAAPPGTKLVELPPSCQLTYDGASDPRLLKLIDQVPAELWGAKLALQLLAHRVQGGSSPFASYVSNLPVGVQGIPIFFPADAIQAINYPPVTSQVNKRCKWLYDFSKALAVLPDTPDDPFAGTRVDINALGWAMACVTSRAFRVRGPAHPAAMLPLIDMANHSFDNNVEVLPLKDGKAGVGLYTKKSVKAGEPLLLSYGPLTNDFLFMDYGFIVPGNPHDRVTLRFDAGLLQAGADMARAKGEDGKPLEIVVDNWRAKWLEQLGLTGPKANTEVSFGGASHVDARLLAAARVLASRQKSDVEGRSLQKLGDLATPLSRANETAALRMLVGVGLFALSQFSCSLEQDVALLTGQPVPGAQSEAAAKPPAPLSNDMAMAVAFRSEKKRLLSSAIEALGARLRQLPNEEGLKPTTSPSALKKGDKLAAATSKGFGSAKKA